MPYFTVNGGYSYAIGEERHADIIAACRAYVDRHDSNGIRAIDGVLYPTWGDTADDEVVITRNDDGHRLTRREVFAIVNGETVIPRDQFDS